MTTIICWRNKALNCHTSEHVASNLAHRHRCVQPCRRFAFAIRMGMPNTLASIIAARFLRPVVFSPCSPWKRPDTSERTDTWQAQVSLTLTQRNEGARGEAYRSTSVWISLSDWCLPVKWSSGLSDMTLVSLWHACSQLTVIGVDGPHSTQPARHSYFDPLFFCFCPPLFPVFCLLATSNQSFEIEAEPSGTCLLSMRSWDEMSVIMGTRQPGGHFTSQVGSVIWDFSGERTATTELT